ncbi:hypothetical protein SUGI_1145750 [Cryptomeria japonica]|uniref:MYB-like transcription factor EOBI n=1 Tax=Cryptomeria japonica TaxID=3369 RepID=UPI002414870C|nr:MYB-like transcription factor EOBI [Cryptomeria japonica]GLJ53702.1 hypothetical protein SUGI_1145750 [Cryptomeria japonica]
MMAKMDSCRLEEQEESLRRGPWTAEEDMSLIRCVSVQGEGRWNTIAKYAGLRRTGKSCRLRWLNYLSPGVKRGNITVEEQLLILELHGKWGNRWSKIAKHLPGRTDNEIKNYWRTRMKKAYGHYRVMGSNYSNQSALPSTAVNTMETQEHRGGTFHSNEISRNYADQEEESWKSPMVGTTHDANITEELRDSATEALPNSNTGLAAINSSESELSALTTDTAKFDVEIDWPYVINNLWRIDDMTADTFW